VLGEKRSATALCATGYVLSIPVFFDTVFYLLVPLARSGYARTNRYYLKYLLAITAGAGATHTLVPPTPGPLAVAGTLGVDLGTMVRSEEHTSELQSRFDLVCRLLLEKK